MEKNVVVLGYGSIGKRHVNNLLSLKINPYVVTSYPEKSDHISFISSIDYCNENVRYGIICTPTVDHLKNFMDLTEKTGCKNILIEKPIAASAKEALEIKRIAKEKNISVFVAYNMRFIKAFDMIKQCVEKHLNNFRIVKIHVGQYLPEWRPYKDYRQSYSARRNQGGGVDLDLSHEIDYMLWFFGMPEKLLLILRKKISVLEIDSPDYFKGIYQYNGFIADVELDYIRKKDRKFLVMGENQDILKVDFIERSIKIMGVESDKKDLFDFETGYIDELKEFLCISSGTRLCGIDESINVLRLLGLE